MSGVHGFRNARNATPVRDVCLENSRVRSGVKMSTTNTQPTNRRGGLRPASLVDGQLDHLERMVQLVTRLDADNTLSQLDHQYWEKRIRALVETHDLVTTQRHRVIRLLDLLEREALFRMRRHTAA